MWASSQAVAACAMGVSSLESTLLDEVLPQFLWSLECVGLFQPSKWNDPVIFNLDVPRQTSNNLTHWTGQLTEGLRPIIDKAASLREFLLSCPFVVSRFGLSWMSSVANDRTHQNALLALSTLDSMLSSISLLLQLPELYVS